MAAQILILSERKPYGDFAYRHLTRAGYGVTLQGPESYSGLHPQLPDLVLQESNALFDDRRAAPKDLDLTQRVVKDITASGKKISMLVVSTTYGTQEMADFMRILRDLDNFDFQRKTYSGEELAAAVRKMLEGRKAVPETTKDSYLVDL